jgi:hypothetical protein
MLIRMGSRESAAASLAIGVVAGAAGTAGMTAYQRLVSKVRSGSSDTSKGSRPSKWSKTQAPAQIGQRVLEGTLDATVPVQRAPRLASAVHWLYGTAQGVGFGAVRAAAPRAPGLLLGAVYGTGVWGASYAVLPRLGIYKPITEYPRTTLALDLSYHLVYGLGVASAFALASRLLMPDDGNATRSSG